MKRAAMLLAIGPVDEQLQSEPSETTVGQATESDVPFEQHDVVVTTNGTRLGSVRGLSSTENGELVLVANDINEEVLDPVPEFEPGVFDQELQFVCPVDAIVNYEAGVVRVPSDVPEYMQALYYDLVEDALGKTVDNIVEVYENDHKPRLESDNYTAEDLHDVQQSIRRFRQRIRTVIEAGEFDSGIEHLQRLDRLDRGYQEAFARLIKRQQATAQAGSADSGPQNRTDDSAPESSHPTKDEAVTAEIREFGRHVDEEVGSRLVEADPEDRPEIVQNALKGVTELRAMVREFDNTDALDSPQKHYDALDKIESQLREWERQAIKDAENSGWDLQSLVESVTRGLEAYSKAKQATAEANATSDAGTDRQPRDDTVHSTRSSQAHARQSEPEDPHTAAKSQSSSISESASRVWNTVTLQNAFSPKCPECNRKSAAPVSGEEDVYQCDNCGNIFDTHPDSRRELEFS